MSGLWHRPWGKHRYHLFVVVEEASSLPGTLLLRSACRNLRRSAEANEEAVRKNPEPPRGSFQNCTGCLTALATAQGRA